MRLVRNFLARNIPGLQICWAAIHFAALIATPTTAASIAIIAIATDHELAGLPRRQGMDFSPTAHKIKRSSDALMTLRTTAPGSDGPRDRNTRNWSCADDPRKFFNNATSDDLRFVRRWMLGVPVVYSALAIALALLGFVIHERGGTIAAGTVPDASHVTLIRD
jgi:hypothetical protein